MLIIGKWLNGYCGTSRVLQTMYCVLVEIMLSYKGLVTQILPQIEKSAGLLLVMFSHFLGLPLVGPQDCNIVLHFLLLKPNTWLFLKGLER